MKIEPIYYKKVFAKRNSKEVRFYWVYYAMFTKRQPLKLDKSEVKDARWVKIKELEHFAKKNDYDLKGLSHKTIMELAKLLRLPL